MHFVDEVSEASVFFCWSIKGTLAESLRRTFEENIWKQETLGINPGYPKANQFLNGWKWWFPTIFYVNIWETIIQLIANHWTKWMVIRFQVYIFIGSTPISQDAAWWLKCKLRLVSPEIRKSKNTSSCWCDWEREGQSKEYPGTPLKNESEISAYPLKNWFGWFRWFISFKNPWSNVQGTLLPSPL